MQINVQVFNVQVLEPRDQVKTGRPYYQDWHIQTAGFPNASVFIVSRPEEGS